MLPDKGGPRLQILTRCFGEVPPELNCECWINVVKVSVDDPICEKFCRKSRVPVYRDLTVFSSNYS